MPRRQPPESAFALVALPINLCLLAVALLCLAPATAAATKTWTDGNGQWDASGSWTPSGQPQAGDDVYLTQSDAIRAVTYYNTTNPTALLNSLKIDATGTGAMTLNMPYTHTLHVATEYVGYNGKGTVIQSAGTNNVSTLYLGYNTGSNGRYSIYNGTLSCSGSLYVGGSDSAAGGTGSLAVQSRGNLTVGGTLKLWNTGSLSLSAGSLTSDSIVNSGGTINWTGGTLSIAGTGGLTVGASGPMGASLTLGTGKTLNVTNTATISSAATLTLSGGSFSAGNVSNSGSFNWTSGTLGITDTGGFTVGASGLLGASLTLGSSKNLNVTNTLTIASDAALTLGGGSLTAGTISNSGSFSWTSGTLGITGTGGFTVGAGGPLGASLALDAGNTLNVTKTMTLQAGSALTLSGGSLTTDSLVNSGGTITWTSGTLSITGKWGLTVGASGPMGASLTLGTGKTLNVTNLATINSGATLTLSGGSFSAGEISNHGSFNWTGGTLSITGGLTVGASGPMGASLTLGAGMTLTTPNNLYVGNPDTGSLNIQNGGQFFDRNGYVGYRAGSNGMVTVDGSGSQWTTSGGIAYIGNTGTGTLVIKNGGQASGIHIIIGNDAGSSGTMTVDGIGSKWASSTSVYVGSSGTGEMNIQNSGQVSSTRGYIGENSGSSGTVTVDGSGSLWNNAGYLCVGGSETQAGGAASLTVTNGGQLTVGGTLKLWKADSTVIVSGGTLTAATIVNYGALMVQSGGTVTVTGDLTNGGSLSVNDAILSAATITNTGTIRGRGHVAGAITNNASGVVAPGSSPGILSVDDIIFAAGSMLQVELGGTARGTEYDVLAASGTVTLQEGSSLAVTLINGFVPQGGDEFDILDFAGLSEQFSPPSLPPLGGGLVWDTSGLYTSGTITVAPEPATLGLVLAGGLVVLRRRR